MNFSSIIRMPKEDIMNLYELQYIQVYKMMVGRDLILEVVELEINIAVN